MQKYHKKIFIVFSKRATISHKNIALCVDIEAIDNVHHFGHKRTNCADVNEGFHAEKSERGKKESERAENKPRTS